MEGILIFAGTTEGRELSETLARAGIAHTICVATEYGETALTPHPSVTVHRGRMGREEMAEFLKNGHFSAVVDATHPFAKEVTANLKAAVGDAAGLFGPLPYLRLGREQGGDAAQLEEMPHCLGLGQEQGGDAARLGEMPPYLSLGREHAGDTAQLLEPFPYLQLGRGHASQSGGGISYFQTEEACARALEGTEGNILLTTGSKGLPAYCRSGKLKERLYVRVLPSVESISLCEKQGIYGKRILAMQGPFTEGLNEAILRQYRISCMVTKESGKAGGFPEKLEAARRTGTQVFAIGRPEESGGYSFAALCRKLEEICGREIPVETGIQMEGPFSGNPITPGKPCSHMQAQLFGNSVVPGTDGTYLEIILAGIGMGNRGCMTNEVEEAIHGADVLLGAGRLLEGLAAKAKKRPYYQASQIIPYLHGIQEKNLSGGRKKIVVLFSGDSGCYSGCQPLYTALMAEIREGRLKAEARILPGISSVSYLASCIGESYQDAAVYSLHGKKVQNLARKIQGSPKTFLLTSGVQDVNWLGRALLGAGMGDCEVVTGRQLSYGGQRVEKHTPLECCSLTEEGLYTCFIQNPNARKKLSHGMADREFIRDKVPMTKEEVREVSICKLRLTEGAVAYDIGSGTGSIAVELASLSDGVQVYAIERNKDAVSLIGQNKAKLGLENITVLEGEAPEALAGLPAATHALIGGSGGRLKEILSALRQINPKMRVVIHAISMETICEIREILAMDGITDKEAVQIQVSRAAEAGNYHLLRSENPVWICAFQFC